MDNLIRVDGHPNLFRDKKTGAIINCNDAAYNQYLNVVSNKMNMKKEIHDLKNDINEIKSLLKQILN